MKSTKFVLEITDFSFIPHPFPTSVVVSDNNKTIRNIVIDENTDDYCFVNLKMKMGIYHFTYKVLSCGDAIFGFRKDNAVNLTNILDGSYFLSFLNQTDDFIIGRLSKKIKNSRSKFFNDGDIIYFIVNLDDNIIQYKKNNNTEYITLYSNISKPLYPFVILKDDGCSVQLKELYKTL